MASRYIANTPEEQKRMLGVIGAGSFEDLLVKIPPKARLARPLSLTPALAGIRVSRSSTVRTPMVSSMARWFCGVLGR